MLLDNLLACRAAEDELVEVAEERDKLSPQLQELAWQKRNLERQNEELKDTVRCAADVSQTQIAKRNQTQIAKGILNSSQEFGATGIWGRHLDLHIPHMEHKHLYLQLVRKALCQILRPASFVAGVLRNLIS